MVKRMYSSITKQKVILFRKQGFSLNEIVIKTMIPKTTIQSWVGAISLSEKAQRRIQQRIREGIIRGNTSTHRRLNRINRETIRWDVLTVRFISHCFFDGGVYTDRVTYYSSHYSLAEQFAHDGHKLFGFRPSWQKTNNAIYRVNFYSRDLTRYLKSIKNKFFETAINFPETSRIALLKSFFDDEGNITWNQNRSSYKIRGYQHDIGILRIIHQLLKSFGIQSRIETKWYEIVVNGKDNIRLFKKIIGFSQGIKLNPARKNSRYKQPLEKAELLRTMIESFA